MQIPGHIAFIMDGNGRWARARGLARTAGHRAGVESLKSTLKAAYDLGVKTVSIFAFSTENWSRPREEVDELFTLLGEYFDTAVEELKKYDVRVTVMGDITPLPKGLVKKIRETVETTKHNTGHIFNVGLNYGGRAEIVRAVNRVLKCGLTHVDEKTFADFLDTSDIPDPDLIIRTSGEQRLSNFMLYQAAYSEFYFTKTLWPQFNKRTLLAAIESYNKRDRRFGTVGNKQDL